MSRKVSLGYIPDFVGAHGVITGENSGGIYESKIVTIKQAQVTEF
jgi:hypothetical protein